MSGAVSVKASLVIGALSEQAEKSFAGAGHISMRRLMETLSNLPLESFVHVCAGSTARRTVLGDQVGRTSNDIKATSIAACGRCKSPRGLVKQELVSLLAASCCFLFFFGDYLGQDSV